MDQRHPRPDMPGTQRGKAQRNPTFGATIDDNQISGSRFHDRSDYRESWARESWAGESDAREKLPAAKGHDRTRDAPLASEMRTQRLYRQEGLTITAVAARLGVPEYRRRRAINQGLGARNFNPCLNDFRIGEAQGALADPEQRAVPILTIALDAGFGSLAPFNRAFRLANGCTPSEFQARAGTGGG